MISPERSASDDNRLNRLHHAAILWLRGEASYQFDKFPLTADQALRDLRPDIRSGVWGAQFGNYLRRAALDAAAYDDYVTSKPDQEHLKMKLLQAAGKTAATGRGLYVVFSFLTEQGAPESALNERSYALLEETPPTALARSIYTDESMRDVWGTALGTAVNELDQHLSRSRPITPDKLGAPHVDMAKGVYIEAAALLLDTMVRWSPVEGALLPAPGVASGIIEPWTTYRA